MGLYRHWYKWADNSPKCKIVTRKSQQGVAENTSNYFCPILIVSSLFSVKTSGVANMTNLQYSTVLLVQQCTRQWKQTSNKRKQDATQWNLHNTMELVLCVVLCCALLGCQTTFSHLADAFIQSDLQMRTMQAIKINKRVLICKCYEKSQLA